MPANAQPYPYPYPYAGPSADIEAMAWNVPGSQNANFMFESAEIRNGELLSTTVSFNIPYIFDVSGTAGDHLIGHVDDDWTLSIPALNVNSPFAGRSEIQCGGPGGTGCTGPYMLTDYTIGSLASQFFYPPAMTFNRSDPESYNPPELLSPGEQFPGSLSVSSVKGNDSGTIDTFQYHTTATVTVTHQFRQWEVRDILAQQIDPVGGVYMSVAPKPLFEFTEEETAHIGQYDHFNWKQIITRAVNDNGEDVVSQDEFASWFAGYPQPAPLLGGPDPRLGGQLGTLADNLDLYWDEALLAGRSDYFYANRDVTLVGEGNRKLGPLYFEDRPNLLVTGREVYFRTSLVGVLEDGSYEDLSVLYPGEGFVFFWKFRQTQDYSGGVASFNNIDPNTAGIGEATYLGNDVPEPSTLCILSGLTMLAVLRRRTR